MKKILLLVIMSVTLLIVAACGNGEKNGNVEKTTTIGEKETSTKDNPQDNNQEKNTTSDEKDEDINGEIIEEKVKFESFLVERCVRKALGKSWDDDITTRELANVKELVIQEVYNPAFVAEMVYKTSEELSTSATKHYYENIVHNMTYIDLSDLKYFVNLEILKIDNVSTDSMIANIDAITNCKKLKELSLLYNFSGETSKNFGGVGYLYWANIIAELPALKKLDFSTYMDEHAKNTLLSKTSNKDIEFVKYNEDTVGRLYWRSVDAVMELKKVSAYAQYKDSWNYEYRGLDKTSKLVYQSNAEGVFPYLEVNSDDDLKNILSSIDKGIEDIIIYLGEDVDNVDFSEFSKFENLVTLTIINKSVTRKLFKTWDDINGVYVYDVEPYKLPRVWNTEALSSNKNLQTISLIGVGGDFSGLSSATSLRELYISGCAIENGEFQKLTNVNTLVTNHIMGGDADIEYNIIDDISKMSNIKFYMATKMGDVSTIIDKFSMLETLIIRKMEYLESEDLDTLIIPTLKNLYINMNSSQMISNEMLMGLKKIENLEVLKIDGFSSFYLDSIDAKLLLEMDELYSVTIPYCNILDEHYSGDRLQRTYATADLANAIVAKTNLSQFIIERTVVDSNVLDPSYITDEFDKKIYNSGIYSGFIDKYMLSKECTIGAYTIEIAVEKVLDALLARDAERLCSVIVEDQLLNYTNEWKDKTKNDVLSDLRFKMFYSSFRWKDETKYLKHSYKIDEQYNEYQILNDEEFLDDLKDDGIDYKKVEEAIQVRLRIYGIEGALETEVWKNIALLKIGGKYYVWM